MKNKLKKFICERFTYPKKYIIFATFYTIVTFIQLMIVQNFIVLNSLATPINGTITIIYSFNLLLVWNIYEKP